MQSKNNDKNNRISLCACVTESEMIRGRNGISIFDEWRKPEEPEDCSRGEIARSCRLGRAF